MSNLTPWDRMRLIEANSKAIHGLELGWFHAASELPTYLDTLIQYGRDNSSGSFLAGGSSSLSFVDDSSFGGGGGDTDASFSESFSQSQRSFLSSSFGDQSG